MRKFKHLLSLTILLIVITASAQSPYFKSYGTATTRYLIADSIKTTNLSGTGTRLVTTDANGKLSFLPTGTSSQILYGNGLWGDLPSTLSVSNITITDSLTVPRLVTNRITSTDSVLHLGDSSVAIWIGADNLFGGAIPDRIYSTTSKGLSIGRLAYANSYHSTAIGLRATTNALYSTAIGQFVSTATTSTSSIVIGKGVSTSQPLVNDLPNTLMIGFGSTYPTLTVFPTITGHNTGEVLIGDDVIPPFDNDHVKLSVIGEGDGITSFFYSASTTEQFNTIFTCKNADSKAISVFFRDSGGNDHENFAVKSNGYVYARKVQVTTSAFPDYVFDKDYKFLSIPELKTYIEKNKKLPEYPSAKEVEKEGMDVGETTRLNTQSIEQITLYIISINERLEKTEKENVEMKKQNDELKKRVTELELKK